MTQLLGGLMRPATQPALRGMRAKKVFRQLGMPESLAGAAIPQRKK